MRLVATLFFLCFANVLSAQNTVSFTPSSDALSFDQKSEIQMLAQAALEFNDRVVVAYSYHKGCFISNEQVGKERIKECIAYLMELGVPKHQIEFKNESNIIGTAHQVGSTEFIRIYLEDNTISPNP